MTKKIRKNLTVFSFVLLFSACVHTGHDSSSLKDSDSCQHDKDTIRCVTYHSNYDGDTFRFNMPNVHSLLAGQSVRLNGIQAGELRGSGECEKRMGQKAKEFAQTTLSAATRIDLEKLNWAQFCRIGANVVIEGKDFGELLVEKKLAFPAQPAPTESDWCSLERSH